MKNIIQTEVAAFHRSMMTAQKDLDDFTDTLNTSLKSITQELDTLPEQTNDLKVHESEPAASLVNGEIEMWTQNLKSCAETARQTITGHAFQHRFQKQPLVVVFGPVKAGKSTLGNFMLGRALRKAPFDNAYRSGLIPEAPIIVEESGRQDVKTKQWFDVNSIESTCSAQYFSVPGLVWVDTPGYGAVEKKEIDIRPLAEIARQYVSYADLVIFLDNSDAVWQREVEAAFRAVYHSGQKVLSAILRSDVTGEEDVIKGKIVTPLLPKSEKDRQDQERYVREGMKACGAKPEDCDVVSISVKLAEEAVATGDSAKWEASGMGVFYRKIAAALADGRVRELKKSAPRLLLQNAVSRVKEILNGLNKGLSTTFQRLSEKYESLSPEGALVDEVATEAVDQLRINIRQIVDQAVSRAESQNAEELSVSLEEIHDEASKAVGGVLMRTVKRMIGDYQCAVSTGFNLEKAKTNLTRKTESIEYSVEVPDWEPRDPEGLWENICAFFGKDYFRATTSTETRTSTIDLGFDDAEARHELIASLEKQAKAYVRRELASIREDFFGVSMKKVETLIIRLKETEKRVANCL